MICSISSELAEEPVVSKYGNIFEKRLIEKHITSTGTCPLTKQPLTLEDLVEVKTTKTVKPRPLAATSIPGLLLLLQNEWDALVLETFNLKKELETTRQELSLAMYQQDAACRVIARLTSERDKARKELSNLQATVVSRQADTGDLMDIEKSLPGISPEIKQQLTDLSHKLSKWRKKRAISETLAKPEEIRGYKCILSKPIHKASSPGILCLDVHPNKLNLILTGGVDRTAVLFNRETGKKEATLSGHNKAVSSVFFHPDEESLITCSHDGCVRTWNPVGGTGRSNWKTTHVIKAHSAEIVQGSLHAMHDFFVTVSKDKSWAFHDLKNGQTLVNVKNPSGDAAFTCGQLHPDGLILGTGTDDSFIRIWDVKSQKNVATFEGHKGKITNLVFSENGYYLATAAEDAIIKLWDLRTPKNIHSLKLDTIVNRLKYDFSGKYLAAATSSELRIFTGKNLEHVQTMHEHLQTVTDVAFWPDSKLLATTSMDRNLKVWGTPNE
eukprot:TRINITY_DN8036_c0_g1_i1.p1 TRINITY_DN8036_c0_g1~~TRINITY_DN8036_c0_g1_i1.p1  ORF type:complete len:497 (-),score=98.44 TRINITY_DN8036_c0_g1_i1:168-1658(-)